MFYPEVDVHDEEDAFPLPPRKEISMSVVTWRTLLVKVVCRQKFFL